MGQLMQELMNKKPYIVTYLTKIRKHQQSLWMKKSDTNHIVEVIHDGNKNVCDIIKFGKANSDCNNELLKEICEKTMHTNIPNVHKLSNPGSLVA